ncbi:MAG: DUF1275 domain-containing protein [Clostridia bacterium]|nr:DUF1275 domain-containing protein [Clostridia bacterium]
MIFIAGGLDAYSYLLRGGVFLTMQTGNIVQIGISIARADFHGALHFLAPIFSFILGIAIAAFVYKKKYGVRITAALAAFAYVIGILFPLGDVPDILANGIIAFGAALHLQIIKSINSFPIATTMCTGNMRSLAECIGERISTKDKKYSLGIFIYSSLIVSFAIGAFITGLIIYAIN